ncbi:hypothetical protein [Actinopolyspora alba]|nr:hypothetical protein [Actinopolyspora alba]
MTAELFSGSVALRDHRDISCHLNLFAHSRERSPVGKEVRQPLLSII